MTCPDDETWTALFEGTLDEYAHASLRQHLENCDECRELAAALTRAQRHDERVSFARQFGRYTLLRQLGQGTFGVVWSAYDGLLDRRVAVKFLNVVEDSERTRVRRRLEREARAMAKISHGNVAHVYEAGELDEQLFMTMEFVEGERLGAWLERTRPGTREVTDLLVAVGRGLAAIHRNGVVHRDFKPDNVVVTGAGVPKIVDFGLADAGAETTLHRTSRPIASPNRSPPATQTTGVVGTPAYMSPEQLAGRDASPKSDQFAFCAVLWEAMYGVRPFEGSTISNLRATILAGSRRTPATSPLRIPRWMHDICVRGLSGNPSDRFDSMETLVTTLNNGRRRHLRRLTLGTSGILGVFCIIATTAVFQLRQRRQQNECAGRRQTVMSVWSEAERTTIRGHFLDTAAPFASGAWAKTDTNLAAYVQDLAGRAETACLDAATNRADPEMTSRVETCIGERSIAVEALVDVLGEAESSPATYAVQASLELPPTRDCDEPNVSTLAPLQGPRARARRTLARAAALWHSGDVDAALVATEQVLGESETLPYLKTEALLRRGQYLWSQRSADAVTQLHAAYAQASTLGHTRYAFLAASELALHELEQGKPEASGVWSHVMEAELGRLEAESGHAEWGPRSQVAQVNARSSSFAGHLERAVLSAGEAVRSQRHVSSQSAGLAQALQTLARVHAEQLDLETALRVAQQALAVATEVYGEGNPRLAVYFATVGTLNHFSSKPGEARDALQTAVKLTEASGAHTVTQAMAYTTLARLELQAGEPTSAKAHASTALAIVDELLERPNERAANVEGILATIAIQESDFEGARRHATTSLEIQVAVLGSNHTAVAGSHSVVATVCSYLDDWDCARTQYEKALSIWRLSPGRIRANEVYALLGLAEVALAQEDPTGAEGHARDAIECRELVSAETRELPEEDAILGTAYFLLARGLEAQGKVEASREAGRQAEHHADRAEPHRVEELKTELAAFLAAL